MSGSGSEEQVGNSATNDTNKRDRKTLWTTAESDSRVTDGGDNVDDRLMAAVTWCILRMKQSNDPTDLLKIGSVLSRCAYLLYGNLTLFRDSI